MKSKFLLVLLSGAGLMLGAASALAASTAVREMADIMMHLEHYPSDADKATLNAIISDKSSTKQERVIATAISHVEHKVAAADAGMLRQVIGDVSAPPEVRDLASIVLNINHYASPEDKRKLEMMEK